MGGIDSLKLDPSTLNCVYETLNSFFYELFFKEEWMASDDTVLVREFIKKTNTLKNLIF